MGAQLTMHTTGSLLGIFLAAWFAIAAGAAPKPNIVLMMADDMGFSDLGCYGGEIETPNLDQLAANGLRFTQFYNTARCCPTRASLLTGLYSHQAGVGHMLRNDRLPGYEGALNKRSVTLAEVLKEGGYTTLMVGKWHVGSAPGKWPLDRGFERYWGTPSGGGVYFKDALQIRKEVFFVEDQTRIEPPDDLYVTDTFTDHAIGFVEEAVKEKKQPFFLYFAHIAPHWPLQAKPEDIEKYRGRYRMGWEEMRRKRHQRQLKLGIISENAKLSPADPEARNWSDLSVEEQEEAAQRMAIYAAQIDCIDQNVGRLVAKLKELGQFENTLFLFLSDNGCSAEGGPGGFSRGQEGAPLGTGLSYASAGLEWANACNTPFRKFKIRTHQGGIASPLVVHWPAGIPGKGELRTGAGHVIDIMPTLAEVAKAKYPKRFRGREILSMEGQSLVRAFRGEREERGPIFWEHQGNKAVRAGDWKVVKHGRNEWELYQLVDDPTEIKDLATTHEPKVQELGQLWNDWATRCGVCEWEELQKHRRDQRN